jgi:hypothetical protein
MSDDPDFSYEAVSRLPDDPFRPIVTLTPIDGFPATVQLPAEDGTGTVDLNLTDRLEKFSLTDTDKKIGKCEITFIDEEGLFTDPNKLLHGAVIDVAFGYPGHMSQKRRLIVRRIKLGLMQGRKFARRRRGYLVTFTALAPGIITHNKAPDTNDVYEGQRLSAVVTIVASKLGYSTAGKGKYKAEISVPDEYDVVRESITRAAPETYEQFLMRLSEEYGLIYTKDGQKGLYFGPRKTDAPASFIVDQDGNNLMGFELDGDLIFGIPAGVRIVGMHPADQKIHETVLNRQTKPSKSGNVQPMAHTSEEATTSTAPDAASGQVEAVDSLAIVGTSAVSASSALNKTHTVMEDYRVSTSDKLAAKTARYYNERIKKQWKLHLRLVGTVDVIAGSTIILVNFQTALLDGLWYVKEVKQTIDQGGFTTELTCRRETSRNVVASPAVIHDTQLLTADKKDKTVSDVDSLALFGSNVITSKTKTSKTGSKRNNHSTDGEFFTTFTDGKK